MSQKDFFQSILSVMDDNGAPTSQFLNHLKYQNAMNSQVSTPVFSQGVLGAVQMGVSSDTPLSHIKRTDSGRKCHNVFRQSDGTIKIEVCDIDGRNPTKMILDQYGNKYSGVMSNYHCSIANQL